MEMKMICIAVLLILATCHCQEPDIRMPPSITKGPDKFYLFKVEERLHLDCVATGVPDPVYEWFKDGSLMDLNSHPNIDYDPAQPGTGSIIISEAYNQDSGYYQCLVENKYGRALSQVLFLQHAVIDVSSGGVGVAEYTAREGDSLVVPCVKQKSIPTPKFTWSYGENENSVAQQPIVFNKRFNIDEEGNLYFSYVVPEDAKNDYVYKCNKLNQILEITTGGSYSRIQINAFNNTSNVKPENMYHTGQGQEIIALKGKEMRLKCLFSGKPEVQIIWKQSGSNSLPPSHTVQSHNTELVVNPVELSDETRYTCSGSNLAGTSDQHINVKVEAEPVFVKDGPQDVNVTEGDTATISCIADAIPAALVQWFIDGRPFEDSKAGNRHKISEDGNSLSISDVCKDCSDGSSDLQNIQCNASNVHGYTYGGGYINILLRTLIAEGDGPVSTELEFGEGKNTTLLCKATSDDSTEIEYSWELEDEEVDYVTDEIWMTDDHSLKIQAKDEETVKKYVGTFTCVASNGYTEARASALVSWEGYSILVTDSGSSHMISDVTYHVVAMVSMMTLLLA